MANGNDSDPIFDLGVPEDKGETVDEEIERLESELAVVTGMLRDLGLIVQRNEQRRVDVQRRLDLLRPVSAQFLVGGNQQ